jgi:hypothetical protein
MHTATDPPTLIYMGRDKHESTFTMVSVHGSLCVRVYVCLSACGPRSVCVTVCVCVCAGVHPD